MKRQTFRLWFANILVVVSALALITFLFILVVPGVSPAAWLLPALTVLVSALALAFAVMEIVTIYRDWNAEEPTK